MCNMHEETPDKSQIIGMPKIKTTKIVYPQVYSYILPDEVENEGSQKIGYTERKDVDTRIREQTHTAAKRHRFEKQWSAPAFFAGEQRDFKDTDFHKFLIKSDIQHRPDLGKEWFYFNNTPEKSKQLFDTFRQHGFAALQNSDSKIPYELRSEQQAAIDKAIEYFRANDNGEFLWNAKPRFGKTLASYDLAKRLGAKKVLIVTNRPAIANSWFDDFEKFVDGYYFISDTGSLAERKSLTREQYNVIEGSDKPMITFLSLQDLKGSKYFGGSHDKLSWVANLDWDLLVIDEAHEGIDTGRTDAAFDIIKRSHTLHLSGTPFKALANQKFAKEAIFNWTYLDEQKEKNKELEVGESGPHTDLPDLRLYTYRISQMIASEVNEGIDIDDVNRDYAFDLNEFFATKDQKFVHENDVREFLRNLSSNEKYPFSTPELRDQLRHTFWYVGNRVESVKALEQLLKQDDVFKDYKIVVAAGDGKSFNEEEADFKGNEKSFDKVKKAIAENTRTITLSCGQLTTGVTVKEWSAVLMLTDIKTPSQYMQAAFRAQNPYRFTENGETKAKKSAYLFDFAPTRVLEIYDNFANALNPKAANGEITEAERKDNIKELLNYFPVISEDVDGKMIELDAEKVLTFPNALAATDIVQARFMTNLLFNDNIKGVFHFPKEVEDILDKMPVEKNKRAESTKQTLDLDDARKVEQGKQAKINENTGVILGEKIYRANIDRVVDNVINQATPEETIDMLPKTVEALAEAPIAKLKEQYKLTTAETDEMRSKTAEKIKLVVSEFENSDDKDPEILKQRLAAVIEHDLVQVKVEQQETKTVETTQKSKEDEVRDHLRAFTRTIPMFVMANSSIDTISIDNFDDQISDEDFIDLTNITKEEFHKLRDGFDYTTDGGERKHFDGVFHTYKFNASIAEFVSEKKKRADYFNTDEDIFELIPNQKNNQIFTPRRVVKMMVDGLEKEQPELFRRTDSTFIDLYMKSGMYITEVVKKLFVHTRHNYSSDAECLKHILENQVYGLAPTGVLHGITTSYIFGFDVNHDISSRNFAHHDLLPETKNNAAPMKLAQLFGNGENMIKFDAVVGNPPYQNGNDQLYAYFVKSATELSDLVSLIFPVGWQKPANSNGLSLLNNEAFKRSGHFVKVDNYHENNSSPITLFAGVATGGVNIMLWNKNHSAEHNLVPLYEYGEFKRNIVLPISKDDIEKPAEILSTWNKVKNTFTNDTATMADNASASKPYGFRADPLIDPTKYGLTLQQEKMKDDDLRLYGLIKRARTFRYVPRGQVQKISPLTDSWKVFVPKAWGNMDEKTGFLGGSFGAVFVGEPGDICSETYIEFGPFETEVEAKNAEKYFKTKFFKAVFYMNKISQNTARETFNKVPQQNWSNASDINWSKSIPEIDQQLYAKYELSQEEIDFIESRIKVMS